MISSLATSNIVEETPCLENLTTDTFKMPFYFGGMEYANAITIKIKNDLSIVNKIEIQNIKGFTNLLKDWDSYDALPVDKKSIDKAIEFINMINDFGIDVYLTSPGPNGEVLVQVKADNRESEFIFYPNKSKYVLFENNNFVKQNDLEKQKLSHLIKWLYKNE